MPHPQGPRLCLLDRDPQELPNSRGFVFITGLQGSSPGPLLEKVDITGPSCFSRFGYGLGKASTMNKPWTGSQQAWFRPSFGHYSPVCCWPRLFDSLGFPAVPWILEDTVSTEPVGIQGRALTTCCSHRRAEPFVQRGQASPSLNTQLRSS